MRRCLIEPNPELDLAAKVLDAAADALLIGNLELASKLVICADMKEIMERAVRMVGALSVEVHRQVHRPAVLPPAERESLRMPATGTEQYIFNRDGWRCRFCSIKVISRPARNAVARIFPNETRWNLKEFVRHSALYAMAASLDHVVPHSRGGTNQIENLVTACYCCQFGRGEWTLKEAELYDPGTSSPLPISGTDLRGSTPCAYDLSRYVYIAINYNA